MAKGKNPFPMKASKGKMPMKGMPPMAAKKTTKKKGK